MRVNQVLLAIPLRLMAFFRTVSRWRKIGLRDQQVLLADIDLSLGASHFDGRQCSCFRLFPVVFQKLLSGRQFALPGAQSCQNSTKSQSRLRTEETVAATCEPELQIRDLDIVLLNTDIAPVHRRAQSVEQILRDLQIQIAGSIGIKAEKRAVHLGVLVVVVL